MTGTEMQTFNTTLLSGSQMDEDFFYQSLNMRKDLLEQARDWMILRAFDNSQIFTSADTYLTGKPLPARFLRIYAPFSDRNQNQTGVFITTPAGIKTPLNPVSFASRFDMKDTDGYYWIDVKNSTIGRTGSVAGTLNLYFIQGSEDIDAEGVWPFPTYAHPMLPYEVAITQKGGVDWDTVNENQVPGNRVDVADIMRALAMWDARLQQAEVGV